MTSTLSVRDLLVRGMLAGFAAGLLALLFAAVFGEPEIDNAIAVEESHAEALPHDHGDEDAGPISRTTQKTSGLATGIAVFGVAIGGIFALVFAAVHGRLGRLRPRTTSALIAGAAFVTVVLIPSLKYPATPPAVGNPDTIGKRTALYIALIAISLAASIVATKFGRSMTPRLGSWNAALAGGALFILITGVAMVLLPAVNEIGDFPADVLWRFRIASIGTRLVLLAGLGIGFGWLVERSLLPSVSPAARVSSQRT